MEIEEQKQKQLELLEQIEQQKLRLETDCFRAQLEEEKRKKTHEVLLTLEIVLNCQSGIFVLTQKIKYTCPTY